MGTPYIPVKRAFANKMELSYVPRNAQDNSILVGLGPCSAMSSIDARHENQCWGTMPSQYYLKKDHSVNCMLESNLLSTKAFYSGNPSNNIKMYEQKNVPNSNNTGIDIIYGSPKPNNTDIYGLSLAGERPPNDGSDQLTQKQREINCSNYINYGKTSDRNINFNDQPSPYRYAYDPRNLNTIQNKTNNFVNATRANNQGPQTVIFTNSNDLPSSESFYAESANNNENLYPKPKCRYYPGNQINTRQLPDRRQRLIAENQHVGNKGLFYSSQPNYNSATGPNYSSTNTYCTPNDINQVKHYPGLTIPVCSTTN